MRRAPEDQSGATAIGEQPGGGLADTAAGACDGDDFCAMLSMSGHYSHSERAIAAGNKGGAAQG